MLNAEVEKLYARLDGLMDRLMTRPTAVHRIAARNVAQQIAELDPYVNGIDMVRSAAVNRYNHRNRSY